MLRSTEAPAWDTPRLRGGYTVHPVPAPLSTILPIKRSVSAGMRNQNLILFKRGKAISGAPIIKGTNQFPNPPIRMGITIKKIIINAWAVTITLYNWSSPIRGPGCLNWRRIRILRPDPTIPDQTPAIKYRVPISLCLHDQIH